MPQRGLPQPEIAAFFGPLPATENDRPALRQPERAWRSPTLRFSPAAWAKLLFLCDLGDTEAGGFGITPADDLLRIEDVQLVQQRCTGASVAFDDLAVACVFDQQVDLGCNPAQFGRIWVHSHPGDFAHRQLGLRLGVARSKHRPFDLPCKTNRRGPLSGE